MLARLLNDRCAYCGDRRTGDVAHTLAGYPACAACHAHLGADADRERLALIRTYRAERRGHGLERLLTLGR